jgi:AbrB family looped-hinge helix DNA binding protein
MALAKVLPRGQITIPQDVRAAVGLEPGDTVQVQVTGADTIQIKVLPRRSLDEWIARFRTDELIDFAQAREQGEADAATEVLNQLRRNLAESSEKPHE